jgi:general stress protein YciG
MATSKRGFASMDMAKQREIASKGGRAAHAKGTAHEFTSDEARVAGRKGGETVSRDRSHMSAIGREGGHSRGARARASQEERTDVERGGTGRTFERQTATEPSGFESANHNPERPLSNQRPERSGDTEQRDHGPFSGRDRI